MGGASRHPKAQSLHRERCPYKGELLKNSITQSYRVSTVQSRFAAEVIHVASIYCASNSHRHTAYDVVRPLLHHRRPCWHVRRSVVPLTEGIPDLVSQRRLDVVRIGVEALMEYRTGGNTKPMQAMLFLGASEAPEYVSRKLQGQVPPSSNGDGNTFALRNPSPAVHAGTRAPAVRAGSDPA